MSSLFFSSTYLLPFNPPAIPPLEATPDFKEKADGGGKRRLIEKASLQTSIRSINNDVLKRNLFLFLEVREVLLVQQRVCKQWRLTPQEQQQFLKNKVRQPRASLKWLYALHQVESSASFPSVPSLLQRRVEALYAPYGLEYQDTAFVFKRQKSFQEIYANSRQLFFRVEAGLKFLGQIRESDPLVIGYEYLQYDVDNRKRLREGTHGPFIHKNELVKDSSGKIFCGVHQGRKVLRSFDYRGSFCLFTHSGKVIRNMEGCPIILLEEGILRLGGRTEHGRFTPPTIGEEIAEYRSNGLTLIQANLEGFYPFETSTISKLKEGVLSFPALLLKLKGIFEDKEGFKDRYLKKGEKRLPNGEIREGNFTLVQDHINSNVYIHCMTEGCRMFPKTIQNLKILLKYAFEFFGRKDPIFQEKGKFSLVKDTRGSFALEENTSYSGLYCWPEIKLQNGIRNYRDKGLVKVVDGEEVH